MKRFQRSARSAAQSMRTTEQAARFDAQSERSAAQSARTSRQSADSVRHDSARHDSTKRAPSTLLERRSRRLASAMTLSRLWHRFGRVVFALIFLVACMFGSLWMRTQMVQDSFTVSRLTTSIAMLNQDVEDRQTQLDSLNAQLPERASKLGLIVSDTSVQVDLNQPVPGQSKDTK